MSKFRAGLRLRALLLLFVSVTCISIGIISVKAIEYRRQTDDIAWLREHGWCYVYVKPAKPEFFWEAIAGNDAGAACFVILGPIRYHDSEKAMEIMRRIRKLRTLEHLRFPIFSCEDYGREAGITAYDDSCLEQLYEMHSLKRIRYLRRQTRVTELGATKLAEYLPNCHIHCGR